MAARAIWKAVLRLGDESVPVKLYSGVEDRKIHFRLLHEKDKVPVKQHMVDPDTGDPVPPEEIRKGYEVEPGTFVTLEPEELEEVQPPASRDVEIVRFVPREAIDHRWYDRPYYLGPDGPVEPWFALVEALEGQELEGVARWVMRNKSYAGALRIVDGYPVLVTLRHAEEVVDAAQLEAPGGRDLDPREIQMAEQLIGALAAPFEPEEWEDTYRLRVLELIEAKASGKLLRLPSPKEREAAEEEDLTGLLASSLKGVQGA